jgi:hypothetical protein
MAVALHEQAIAFDVGEGGCGQVILSEEVACRVMGEALWYGAAYADQSVEWIVAIAAVAFAAVVDAGQIAIGVVLIAVLEQVFVPLADALRLQSALFIVIGIG